MLSTRDALWPTNDVFDDPMPLDPRVMRPIEAEDVDEPLDVISGIAIASVGGLLIWGLIIFTLIKLI